jgi:hypothetical protein
MSLGALASHVATLPDFAMHMLAGDEHDMATSPYRPFIAKSAEELVARFDEASAAARAAVAGAPPRAHGTTAGSCAWASRCSSTTAAAACCASTS